MTEKRRFNRVAMSMNPRFHYVDEADRYLSARVEPKYKFNIIGTGIMGQEHIRTTLMEGRATIYGIFDPHPASIAAAQRENEQFNPGSELVVYDSLYDACNDPAVDGLVICTPNFSHIDVVATAVPSGKHILLEKPVATTVKDAYKLMQLSERHEAVFQVGLQYRYKPTYTEALYEVLNRETIGQVQTLNMIEHRMPFLDKVGQWNKFAKYSGDTLVEKCCHYFDLMNKLSGSRPKTVYAVGSQAVNFTDFERDGEKSDILDNGMVITTYENGVTANFSLCMFAPMFYEELIVCGDEGRLKTWENEDFLPHNKPSTGLEIYTVDGRPSRTTQPMYPALVQGSGHQGATYVEHAEFIDMIEGKQTRAASAEEGFWAIVVGAAAQHSIKTGAAVDVAEFVAQEGVEL